VKKREQWKETVARWADRFSGTVTQTGKQLRAENRRTDKKRRESHRKAKGLGGCHG